MNTAANQAFHTHDLNGGENDSTHEFNEPPTDYQDHHNKRSPILAFAPEHHNTDDEGNSAASSIRVPHEDLGDNNTPANQAESFNGLVNSTVLKYLNYSRSHAPEESFQHCIKDINKVHSNYLKLTQKGQFDSSLDDVAQNFMKILGYDTYSEFLEKLNEFKLQKHLEKFNEIITTTQGIYNAHKKIGSNKKAAFIRSYLEIKKVLFYYSRLCEVFPKHRGSYLPMTLEFIKKLDFISPEDLMKELSFVNKMNVSKRAAYADTLESKFPEDDIPLLIKTPLIEPLAGSHGGSITINADTNTAPAQKGKASVTQTADIDLGKVPQDSLVGGTNENQQNMGAEAKEKSSDTFDIHGRTVKIGKKDGQPAVQIIDGEGKKVIKIPKEIENNKEAILLFAELSIITILGDKLQEKGTKIGKSIENDTNEGSEYKYGDIKFQKFSRETSKKQGLEKYLSKTTEEIVYLKSDIGESKDFPQDTSTRDMILNTLESVKWEIEEKLEAYISGNPIIYSTIHPKPSETTNEGKYGYSFSYSSLGQDDHIKITVSKNGKKEDTFIFPGYWITEKGRDTIEDHIINKIRKKKVRFPKFINFGFKSKKFDGEHFRRGEFLDGMGETISGAPKNYQTNSLLGEGDGMYEFKRRKGFFGVIPSLIFKKKTFAGELRSIFSERNNTLVREVSKVKKPFEQKPVKKEKMEKQPKHQELTTGKVQTDITYKVNNKKTHYKVTATIGEETFEEKLSKRKLAENNVDEQYIEKYFQTLYCLANFSKLHDKKTKTFNGISYWTQKHTDGDHFYWGENTHYIKNFYDTATGMLEHVLTEDVKKMRKILGLRVKN